MKITWRYIARIYSEKLHEFQKADNFLIPPADSINSLRLRPIDAFLEAYRWFHSNFKITSSELTLQQRPSDLWRSRTGGLGECSALFYSLLAKLRILSQPYLCSSRLHGEPLPNIPALFWFDKFLLMVPFGRDTIWTDLESPQLPLDIVPFGNQGILGLNIGDEPGAFVRTPRIDYRDNGKAIHMDISLDTLGNFDCDVTEIYSHAMIVEALDLLTEFSRADLQFAWEKEVLKEVPGAKLRKFVIIPRDSTTDVFRIAYQFSAAGIYRPQADRIYIPADFFGNWAGLPLMTENIRYSPMEIDRPRFELERISIKIPANYRVAFLPESKTYDSFLGEYFTAFRAVNDAITVTRAFGFKRANMPSTAYDAMKKFLYKIHAEADKQIILRRIN